MVSVVLVTDLHTGRGTYLWMQMRRDFPQTNRSVCADTTLLVTGLQSCEVSKGFNVQIVVVQFWRQMYD